MAAGEVTPPPIQGALTMTLTLYPAIDLKGGQVVRLKRGEMDQATVYADDPGAQAVAKDLGGLPVTTNESLPPGAVRVVLSTDYTGPGSGLGGGDLSTPERSDTDPAEAPVLSPILTAGSNDPQCVN